MGITAQTTVRVQLLCAALCWSAFLVLAADSAAQQASSRYEFKVEQAQHRLVRLGYRLGTIDGRLGNQTVEALRTFQRDQDLPVTGRPSRETLRALERAAPGPIDQTRLTNQGLVGYLNRRSGKCRQDNPAAILANTMARGVRLDLRDDKLTVKTSYEVTPYQEAAEALRAVKHAKRYVITAGTVDMDSIIIDPVDHRPASPCYRLRLSCLQGESCITEGYANQRESISVIFARASPDREQLLGTWRRLLSRLGAGKPPEPAEQAEQPLGEEATANRPTAATTPPD